MPTSSEGVPTGPARRLPADRRREQLLEVALHLFAGKGFNATTMDDIADAAGVTKPLLYQHFVSKRALYIELMDTVAQTLLEEIAKAVAAALGPRQQVERGFAAYFGLVVRQTDAFRLLFANDVANDAELSRAVRHVEDTIADFVGPLIEAGLDPEHRSWLAHAVVGMAEGASRRYLAIRDAKSPSSAPDDLDSERLARRLADLAWAGLRSVHPD